jgi:hypothetical protein
MIVFDYRKVTYEKIMPNSQALRQWQSTAFISPF